MPPCSSTCRMTMPSAAKWGSTQEQEPGDPKGTCGFDSHQSKDCSQTVKAPGTTSTSEVQRSACNAQFDQASEGNAQRFLANPSPVWFGQQWPKRSPVQSVP